MLPLFLPLVSCPVIAGPDEPGHAVRGLRVRQRVRGRHLRRDQGTTSNPSNHIDSLVLGCVTHTGAHVHSIEQTVARRRQASRCFYLWCSVGVGLRRRRPNVPPS
jgi:hypothetical protein